MTMHQARWLVLAGGIALPYLARLPRGLDWLAQYTDGGLDAALFLGGFNAVAWVAVLLFSLAYRRPRSILAPALPGVAVLGGMHFALDLAADAQAGLALIAIPFVALVPIAVGGVIGIFLDRHARNAPA